MPSDVFKILIHEKIIQSTPKNTFCLLTMQNHPKGKICICLICICITHALQNKMMNNAGPIQGGHNCIVLQKFIDKAHRFRNNVNMSKGHNHDL